MAGNKSPTIAASKCYGEPNGEILAGDYPLIKSRLREIGKRDENLALRRVTFCSYPNETLIKN
jgi:hypothetical protein